MSFYGFCKFFVSVAARILFDVKLEGVHKIPKDKGIIVVSNHRTYFDPIFLGMGYRKKMIFIAKQELFDVPVLSFFIKRLDIIPVNRGSGDTSVLDKSVEALKNKNVLCVFPEGTRSKDGKMNRIKSGATMIALKSKVDILPACVKYEGHLKFRRKVVIKFGDEINIGDLSTGDVDTKIVKQINKEIDKAIKSLLEE